MLTDTELSNFRTFLTRHGGIPLKEFGPQGAFDSAPDLRTAAQGAAYGRAIVERLLRRRYPTMAMDESDYEGAKGVAGALIPGAESLVPDRRPAGAMDDDGAAALLAYLQDKLSPEDLEQVRNLLETGAGTVGPRDDAVGSSSPGHTRNWQDGYKTHAQACDEWARISKRPRPPKRFGQDARRPQSTSFDSMFPNAKKIRL
jgi:hypothetical protein